MGRLRSIFFRGLITFLPIAVTIYLLYAGIAIADSLLGNLLRAIFPQFYVPGLGLLLTITIVFMLGLMLNSLFITTILNQLEKRLYSIPLIKTVYSPLRDLMNLFSQKGQKNLKSVVLVDVGANGMQALGLVTRDTFRDLKEIQEHAKGKVAVYIPWSYGLGGLTFLIPQDRVLPVDLPVERAMSLALTAWVKGHEDDETPLRSAGPHHDGGTLSNG